MPDIRPFKLSEAIGDGQSLAMNQYRLADAQRGQQAQQGLTQALQTGTPEALTSYSQQFPQEAMKYQGDKLDQRSKEISHVLTEVGVIEKIASGVSDETTYQRGKEILSSAGIDISQYPPNFDPNWVKQQTQQMLGFKGKLELELKEFEKSRQLGQDSRDERRVRVLEANSGNAGKPPAGYRFKADGNLEPIPGGPADAKRDAASKKANLATQNSITKANLVVQKVDEALNKSGFFTTGLTGAITGVVPGTSSYDLDRTIDTIKAAVGFGELQAMRDASPTGGALGAIAVQELNMLQSTIASLDKKQSQDQLKSNLESIKRHFTNWKNTMEKSMVAEEQGLTNENQDTGGGWGIEPAQ